jgi:hypothetical protein
MILMGKIGDLVNKIHLDISRVLMDSSKGVCIKLWKPSTINLHISLVLMGHRKRKLLGMSLLMMCKFHQGIKLELSQYMLGQQDNH